ncbi:SET and MYND domain-containing protein 4 [Engraulis encrasicolus]|uniref:SET and MYND domain-containing protein 4 n=1 Tax=Engraulis encrasicolus TaxID=184585 RepID=UPI002FD2AB10
MDLPCPDWIKHAEQIWSRLYPDQKKTFSTQLDIDEMFDFGQSHTTPDDVRIMSDIGRTTPVQKCAQSALTLRERGNGSFKKKDYTSAVLHYTQGVCHAPGDSEQLALCYANRSAALFHLRRYQECLEDISRALEHGYPSHLQPKLLSRRAQCQACLPSHQPGQDGASTTLHSPTLTPTSTPSSNSRPQTQGSQPHASSPLMGLSLRFSPEKGRHLVVVEGRRAGEVLLEDQAFSCVLIPGEGLRGGQEQGDDRGVGMGLRKGAGGAKKETFGTEERCCHRCLRPSLCLVPCPGCSYTRYCHRPCQQQAWKEHHRWECPLGAELRAAGVLAQLALRVALKAGLQRVQRARDTQQQRETRRQSDQEVLEESKDDIGRGNTSGPHTQEVCGNGKDSIGKGNTCGTDTTTSPLACVQAGSSTLPAHEPTMTYDPSMGCHGDMYQRVYSLLPHVEGHPASLRFLYAVTMATLFQALRQAGPPPPSWGGGDCNMSDGCSVQSAGEDGACDAWRPELSMLGATALRHLLQLRANAQAIITERVADNSSDAAVQASQEVRLGTAIFPTLSLLNHACRPNTSLAFDPCCRGNSSEGTSPHLVSSPDSSVTGVSVTVRASRDLRDGEELLHCYGPHCSRMEVQERQRLLLDQYMFTCQCEACLQDLQSPAEGLSAKSHYKCPKCAKALQAKAGMYVCVHKGCSGQVSREQLEGILRTLKALLDQALELLDMDQPDEALPFLHEAMNKARRHLLDTHRLHGQLSDASARAYASMGMWSEAASHLRVSVESVRGQFGEDSVELGQQLFKLTQLHFNGGQAGPALCVLAEARRVLSLHRHTHSEELQELQAMEDCLRGSR